MPSQSAHLFFSYAHDDAARLTPIHAQMQNVLERNLWLDKVGLERGMAWNNAIKAAIDDSYGVIFAVTKTFVTRPFILEREIPWALDRFKDKQGVQLFPILFDDVELPELLKTPYITYPIKAFELSFEAVLKELKEKLPAPQTGVLPFMVDWPRLANFKGRDNQLIELHQQLMGDGRQGVKTVGLHGTGGIGKTQLAVEYAHRYRYHYPGGVYWLNAGADWRKEVAACAVNLDRNLIEKSDEEKALAFRDFLATQGKDVLLVLDNVDDPSEVTRREIAPRLTIAKICGETRTRLLLTTRVQTLPAGFESVSVDVLKQEDARAVLVDAWISGARKEAADTKSLDEIAKTLGYLPLGLILATAALTKRTNLSPSKLLEHLRALGIDSIADKVGLDKAGPAGYVSRVDVALEWQIGQLEREDSRALLVLLAAFGEAAVTPRERLRLLSGLVDDDLDAPFIDAVAELTDYHLIEPLSEGTDFRLHPLTQQYATRQLNPTDKLNEAVQHLVAAYRNPATLDAQTRMRGFAAVMEDLTSTQRVLLVPNNSINSLARLLALEEQHLLTLPNETQMGYLIQQIRARAHQESDDDLKVKCDKWLRGKMHLSHDGQKYTANKALIRILSLHTDKVIGAIQLSDGRLLSWSDDKTLRLWKADGTPDTILTGHTRRVFELSNGRLLSWSIGKTLCLWKADGTPDTILTGHTSLVIGALELRDERILSWAGDKTLRLWKADGTPDAILTGHTSKVTGALELRDRRILSWAEGDFGRSDDRTLRLWKADGTPDAVLTGHTSGVVGALELKNGRILSWSGDKTLRLWKADGTPDAVLTGQTSRVNGALELKDGRILSWSGDKTLRLWKADGTLDVILTGFTRSVSGALELRDGHILAWSRSGFGSNDDKMLLLWKADGTLDAILAKHSNGVLGALELKDGRILSWSGDKTLRLWKADGTPDTILTGHTGMIVGALELKDGRILSWSDDKTLRLWKADGTPDTILLGHGSIIRGLLKLRDGNFLSWAGVGGSKDDKTLRLWKMDGTTEAVLTGHTSSISGALELQDGCILSWAGDGFNSSEDKTLRLWKMDGTTEAVLTGHTSNVSGALELQDGRILSWAGRGTNSNDNILLLWKTDRTHDAMLKGHMSGVTGALELQDGRILSWAGGGFNGSEDTTLRLWKMDGTAEAVLTGHTSNVSGVLELQDGHILSWGTREKTLRLWKTNGTPDAIFIGHTNGIVGALELQDGRILSWSNGGKFSNTDKDIRLWKADGTFDATFPLYTGGNTRILELQNKYILMWSIEVKTLWLQSLASNLVIQLKGHTGKISGALELHDGRIISWATDNTLRLWSSRGKPLAVYANDSAITCCIMTKDEQIVVGDAGGRVLFLRLMEGD